MPKLITSLNNDTDEEDEIAPVAIFQFESYYDLIKVLLKKSIANRKIGLPDQNEHTRENKHIIVKSSDQPPNSLSQNI